MIPSKLPLCVISLAPHLTGAFLDLRFVVGLAPELGLDDGGPVHRFVISLLPFFVQRLGFAFPFGSPTTPPLLSKAYSFFRWRWLLHQAPLFFFFSLLLCGAVIIPGLIKLV